MTSKSTNEINQAFLSRGLAALAINRLAEKDVEASAKAVTDGGYDGTLDALYFDHMTETIFFVQSKWSRNGARTIDLGSASKFVDGISKITNDDFSSFNDKIKAQEPAIRSVLFSGVNVT